MSGHWAEFLGTVEEQTLQTLPLRHLENAWLFSGVVLLWLPASLKDIIKRNDIETLKA